MIARVTTAHRVREVSASNASASVASRVRAAVRASFRVGAISACVATGTACGAIAGAIMGYVTARGVMRGAVRGAVAGASTLLEAVDQSDAREGVGGDGVVASPMTRADTEDTNVSDAAHYAVFTDENGTPRVLHVSFTHAANFIQVLRALERRESGHATSSSASASEVRAASETTIQSLPRRVVTAEDCRTSECAVCLESHAIGQTIKTLPCAHEFHTQCVDRWLRRRDACPVCRSRATTIQTTQTKSDNGRWKSDAADCPITL